MFENEKNLQFQDEDMTHDMTTSLRSELAAVEYKRDRLSSEVSLRIIIIIAS